jgi:hypothetical protein
MDPSCKSSLYQEMVTFKITNTAGKKIMSDLNFEEILYTWRGGQSWIVMNKLPADTYTIAATYSKSPVNTGKMPFALLTFGETSKVAFQ